MSNFGKRELALAVLVLLVTAGIVIYKVQVLGYSMTMIRPEDGYFVRMMITVKGNGKTCNVHAVLPLQSERQTIKYETESSGSEFTYSIAPNRVAHWQAKNLKGEHSLTKTFFAQTEGRTYPLPEGEAIPATPPEDMEMFLVATERIQVDAPEIVAKAFELAPEGTDIRTALKSVYNYCYSRVKFQKVRGPTNAVTALKLEEASCNGKNRLMVALLRARGIPARMVNGILLETSRKRTTHAWTEARVHDTWVPFCPTNGYFAEIPEHYLELSKGDMAIFTHTRHIGFDWRFSIQHQTSHRDRANFSNANNPMNILHTWLSLKDYHISLDLIMVILMIPIGATVVAFARNVIGLLPFGTFMPALIAVAFRDTGLMVGIAFFVVVILVGTVANFGLVRLRILHIPRLVIIITIVVISIMLLSILCLRLGLATGAAVSLFPMAILSLTCERFTQTLMQDGWKDASRRMAVTIVVASACYGVYNIELLQIVIVAFPELLLCNIAVCIVIGSWTGLRLTDYIRFCGLRGGQEPDAAA